VFDENGKLLGSSSSPIQIWKAGDCVEVMLKKKLISSVLVVDAVFKFTWHIG
jgi:hypothetical protein